MKPEPFAVLVDPTRQEALPKKFGLGYGHLKRTNQPPVNPVSVHDYSMKT